MPTPKAGYFLKDGSRVPGTTTIIGRFKDPGGLYHWYWEKGAQGKGFKEDLDKAANLGTIAHHLVEQYIRGQNPNLTDVPPEALSAFNAYLAWAKNYRVKIIATEVQLVSEKYRFGGTPDAIGIIE